MTNSTVAETIEKLRLYRRIWFKPEHLQEDHLVNMPPTLVERTAADHLERLQAENE